jgi:aryl-alcohol dehydrogenase-like predicted oxidoreductase
MQMLEFGQNKTAVSQLCLGAMLLGTKVSKEDSFAVLDDFIIRGGNFIDTANCYAWWVGQQYNGHESEKLLGEWMHSRGNRDKVFLATKMGAQIRNLKRLHKEDGNFHFEWAEEEYEDLAPATIRKAIEESLRRLKTDYVDLYYIHRDDRDTPQEETLAVFDELVREGKVREIGCSNIRTWRLERARQISDRQGWTKFTAIQQQYSYLRPKVGLDIGDTDAELLDYLAANHDLTLLAYSPILKGIYAGKEKRESVNYWHQFNHLDSHVRLKALDAMAVEMGVTAGNLVLAWLMHQERVIPIVGFSKQEQYTENMQSLEIKLGEDQIQILNEAMG